MRLSWWHILVVVLIFVVLFGAKRMPDLARSLGRSMRIMKAEVKGLRDDDVEAKAEPKSGRQPLTADDEVEVVEPVRRTNKA